MDDIVTYVLLGLLALVVVVSIGSASRMFVRIEQQTIGIVERFGKFRRTLQPGLNVINPFTDRVVKRVNLRTKQLLVKAETKTNDNVFVNVAVSVQYQVKSDKDSVFSAFYNLQEPEAQMTSYVLDVVRAKVPKLALDGVFAEKDEIAKEVKDELNRTMNQNGLFIVTALVTEIDPDEKVKNAMNDINAAQREQVAAQARGEGAKTLKVKAAEAEKEAMILQGQGVAGQRQAIAKGVSESTEILRQAFGDEAGKLSPEQMMRMLFTPQYIEMLKEVAGQSHSNLVFLSESPTALDALMQSVASGIKVGATPPPPAPAESQDETLVQVDPEGKPAKGRVAPRTS